MNKLLVFLRLKKPDGVNFLEAFGKNTRSE